MEAVSRGALVAAGERVGGTDFSSGYIELQSN